MSVTFAPAETETTGYTNDCLDCEETWGTFTGWEAARAHLVQVRPGHAADTGCDQFSVFSSPIGPKLNVSNTNGGHILDALGLKPEGSDLTGAVPAGDFLGRVLLALAIAPADEGVPSEDMPKTGVLMVNCGRRAGYLQEQLGYLREVADYAVAHNIEVQWG